MTVDVRPARAEDAHGIAEAHVLAWQQTYAHLVPSEVLAGLSVEQRELRWTQILARPGLDIAVATDHGAIVGFASAHTDGDSNEPRDRELESIYLLAGQHGSGLGQRLLDAVIGDAPAFLWVAEDNPRARAFYTRNGFAVDGTTKVGPVAGTPVLEVRMVR
jgi:ribosomal protein S18 acetylase RimI-like enzyme